MKREIVCPQCEKAQSLHREYPGEHIKLTKGNAKSELLCDSCAQPIYFGDTCFAVSMWADYGGIQYYPWESEYIDVAA